MRRTKQEAEATRAHIIDTAELVFERRGVSGTSLNDIATAAGLTRGAIYWHFEDKADLFNAMMERVTLPLEEAGSIFGFAKDSDSLTAMRDGFVGVLRRVVDDPQTQRVFGIAIHKVEYVDETAAVRERHLAIRNRFVDEVERVLERAVPGGAPPRLPPRAAAIGLHALLDGLLGNWTLDPAGFDLVEVGAQAIDTYLAAVVRPEGGRRRLA